jgi:hypothetical protein
MVNRHTEEESKIVNRPTQQEGKTVNRQQTYPRRR